MDVQRLIGEVARRHNVLLGPDDPILVTLTLNELILTGYLERVQALLEAAQDQTSAGTAQHLAAAREIAARLVSEAAGYVAGQLTEAGAGIEARLLEAVGRELEAAREAAHGAAQARRVAVFAALVATGVTCGLAGVVIGLVVGPI
jgi:Transcriptional activator TraM